MTDDLWKLLTSVDTPTVLNAIEVVQGERGYNNFTHQTMVCMDASLPSIVGYARTATIKGSAPSREPEATVRKKRMDYYQYMFAGQRPGIVVVEDIDWPRCVGAFWGEINNAIHCGCGLAGTVTNGVIRDLGFPEPGYQVIGGSVGASHCFVNVVDFAQPVTVLGVVVSPGDLVHADRHGALVIPPEVVGRLEQAIIKLLETEKLILDPARASGFDFDTFKKAWTAFEASRT